MITRCMLDMFPNRHLMLSIVALGVLLLLSACGTVTDIIPDRRPDYRTSAPTSPLEMPPDLIASTLDDALQVPDLAPRDRATLSAYSRERQTGLPSEPVVRAPESVRVERDGDRRWLVSDQAAEQLWPQVRAFWVDNGFPLSRDEPSIGILETDWLENRADISDGPVRAVLSRFLDFAYSAPTRDRFRVRLERVTEGTEIYLTHYGVEEQLVTAGRGRTATESTTTVWQSRPRDPELEAEMLTRLMVHLGTAESSARDALATEPATPSGEQPRARQISNELGEQALLVEQDYNETWRRVGLTLDSERFVVEDQNRNEGLYLVEQIDTTAQQGGGVFSRLAFWRSEREGGPKGTGERFRVRLAGQGAQTLIVIHDLDGNVDNSPEGLALLETLGEALQ